MELEKRENCNIFASLIPSELQIAIFTLCSPTDIFHLSLSSRNFYVLIQAHRARLPKHRVEMKLSYYDHKGNWRLAISRPMKKENSRWGIFGSFKLLSDAQRTNSLGLKIHAKLCQDKGKIKRFAVVPLHRVLGLQKEMRYLYATKIKIDAFSGEHHPRRRRCRVPEQWWNFLSQYFNKSSNRYKPETVLIGNVDFSRLAINVWISFLSSMKNDARQIRHLQFYGCIFPNGCYGWPALCRAGLLSEAVEEYVEHRNQQKILPNAAVEILVQMFKRPVDAQRLDIRLYDVLDQSMYGGIEIKDIIHAIEAWRHQAEVGVIRSGDWQTRNISLHMKMSFCKLDNGKHAEITKWRVLAAEYFVHDEMICRNCWVVAKSDRQSIMVACVDTRLDFHIYIVGLQTSSGRVDKTGVLPGDDQPLDAWICNALAARVERNAMRNGLRLLGLMSVAECARSAVGKQHQTTVAAANARL